MFNIIRLFWALVVAALLLILLVFSSCSVSREQRRQSKCERAMFRHGCDWPAPDTVTNTNTVTITRDTTIYVKVPGEKAVDSVPVPFPFTTSKNVINTSYALSIAWVENGFLHHELRQVKASVPVTIPGAIQNTSASSLRIEKVPYTVKVPLEKQRSWLQTTLIYSGAIAWFFLLFILFLRIRKLLTPYKLS